MKFRFSLETEIEIEFDEASEAFKTLHANYNRYIETCDTEGLAESIAKQLVAHGVYHQIEGVGSVKIDGDEQDEIDHPINVNTLGNVTMSGHFELMASKIHI